MSLRIASYNCKGFKPRNFTYLNNLFKSVDILFLQELWLFPQEFNKISKVFDDCNFHAVSDMKDNDLVEGRPYGGVGIE